MAQPSSASSFLPVIPAARPERAHTTNLSRTASHTSTVTLSARPRRRKLPTSSFIPATEPGGGRFAEKLEDRDKRLVPGPGAYVVPGGMGPQVERRTNRISSIGPPIGGSPSSVDYAHTYARARVARKLTLGKRAIEALARMWDEDRDGLVSRAELARATSSLGLQLSYEEVDFIFSLYDSNGDGGIDLNELQAAIESGGLNWNAVKQTINIDDVEPYMPNAPLPASAGPRRRRALMNFQLKADQSQPLREQLRNSLTRQHARILDLFKEWDIGSADGNITASEFEDGIRRLGWKGDSATVDALFREWDADGDGHLSLDEFNKILRHNGTVRLPAFSPERLAELAAGQEGKKSEALARKLKYSIGRKVCMSRREGPTPLEST